MYTSVRRYQIDPKNTDELLRRIETGFLPLVTSAKGFVSYAVVPQGAAVATISVFQDKAGADESTRLAADFVARELSALVPTPPEVISGEERIERHA